MNAIIPYTRRREAGTGRFALPARLRPLLERRTAPVDRDKFAPDIHRSAIRILIGVLALFVCTR
jgi:hypothetical protein